MDLVNNLVNNLKWNEFGIVCNSQEQRDFYHKFLREAVLDRRICISKVIGVKVMQVEKSAKGLTNIYIARHSAIGESYPELANKLQDKIFITTKNIKVEAELKLGDNKASDVYFKSARDVIVPHLFEVNDICRTLNGPVNLGLVLHYGYGYQSMTDNSARLKSKESNSYFPCNTDFSLAPYVRVLPPVGSPNIIQVRYYNGMTPDLFKSILLNWSEYLDSNNSIKPVREWLAAFTDK